MAQSTANLRLNFLGKNVRLARDSWQTSGRVYYFNETALILLTNGSNYEVINIQDFGSFTIEVQEQKGDFGVMEANLNKQVLNVSEIMPKIME